MRFLGIMKRAARFAPQIQCFPERYDLAAAILRTLRHERQRIEECEPRPASAKLAVRLLSGAKELSEEPRALPDSQHEVHVAGVGRLCNESSTYSIAAQGMCALDL